MYPTRSQIYHRWVLIFITIYYLQLLKLILIVVVNSVWLCFSTTIKIIVHLFLLTSFLPLIKWNVLLLLSLRM